MSESEHNDDYIEPELQEMVEDILSQVTEDYEYETLFAASFLDVVEGRMEHEIEVRYSVNVLELSENQKQALEQRALEDSQELQDTLGFQDPSAVYDGIHEVGDELVVCIMVRDNTMEDDLLVEEIPAVVYNTHRDAIDVTYQITREDVSDQERGRLTKNTLTYAQDTIHTLGWNVYNLVSRCDDPIFEEDDRAYSVTITIEQNTEGWRENV